jgi:lipoyl(octanoyl) transferase
VNILINKQVQFRHLNCLDYKQAWDAQEELFARIVGLKIRNRHAAPSDQQPTPNYLLFCQHPHVYTLGKSGKAEHLLVNETGLSQIGASYYHINRGGDITYHGPGQIVGYPIIDLENFFTDIHRYLRTLEEAIILTLADYGIDAGRIPGLTGVWIDYAEGRNPRKICAMGVKTSRWVTMHGFAFNVNTDLTYFGHIVPCGITGKAVTSMAQELGAVQDLPAVEQRLLRHLVRLFEMELKIPEISPAPAPELLPGP